MSVKMPEAVAEIMSGYVIVWAGTGPIAPLIERTGAQTGSLLITTDQAEAYAQAVRREALEEASDLLEQAFMEEMKSRIPGEDLDEADEQFNAFQGARAFGVSRAQQIIRALIPQEGK